jgi:hypothetical protein
VMHGSCSRAIYPSGRGGAKGDDEVVLLVRTERAMAVDASDEATRTLPLYTSSSPPVRGGDTNTNTNTYTPTPAARPISHHTSRVEHAYRRRAKIHTSGPPASGVLSQIDRLSRRGHGVDIAIAIFPPSRQKAPRVASPCYRAAKKLAPRNAPVCDPPRRLAFCTGRVPLIVTFISLTDRAPPRRRVALSHHRVNVSRAVRDTCVPSPAEKVNARGTGSVCVADVIDVGGAMLIR